MVVFVGWFHQQNIRWRILVGHEKCRSNICFLNWKKDHLEQPHQTYILFSFEMGAHHAHGSSCISCHTLSSEEQHRFNVPSSSSVDTRFRGTFIKMILFLDCCLSLLLLKEVVLGMCVDRSCLLPKGSRDFLAGWMMDANNANHMFHILNEGYIILVASIHSFIHSFMMLVIITTISAAAAAAAASSNLSYSTSSICGEWVNGSFKSF